MTFSIRNQVDVINRLHLNLICNRFFLYEKNIEQYLHNDSAAFWISTAFKIKRHVCSLLKFASGVGCMCIVRVSMPTNVGRWFARSAFEQWYKGQLSRRCTSMRFQVSTLWCTRLHCRNFRKNAMCAIRERVRLWSWRNCWNGVDNYVLVHECDGFVRMIVGFGWFIGWIFGYCWKIYGKVMCWCLFKEFVKVFVIFRNELENQ